jgi:hypothetical protein
MSRTRFLSILLLVAQFMTTGTLAARPLQRALLQSGSHGNQLIDYIGGSGGSIQLTDVPIDSSVNYIFPLSFAIDADANGNTQNGVFSPYWASSLSPQAATSFVQAYPNVKLVASLAGFSQYISSTGTTQMVNWYDPSDTNAWISNAVSSITSIVQQYSLSGIDIDYENFPESSTFTECIGGLISQLKSSNTISIASIAPFGQTLPIYQDLFSNFGSSIDYVNYQIYADGLSSQDEYVSQFNNVASSLDPSKMMMSVEVGQGGSPGRGLTGSDFISAAQQVSIAGIMVFDADNSMSNSFSTENLVTAYLSS